MILIVDYGMGNLCSIQKALDKLNLDYVVSDKEEYFENCSHIILPGVGFFREGMKNLEQKNIISFLKKQVLIKKKPLLGICLGMQLLFESSTEGEFSKGLGFISGNIEKFQISNLKIPHVGWNNIIFDNEISILENIPNNSDFYFVHSYHVMLDDIKKQKDLKFAITNYGYDFVSVVQKENIFGTQFHPEKSQKYGLKILENFSRMGLN